MPVKSVQWSVLKDVNGRMRPEISYIASLCLPIYWAFSTLIWLTLYYLSSFSIWSQRHFNHRRTDDFALLVYQGMIWESGQRVNGSSELQSRGDTRTVLSPSWPSVGKSSSMKCQCYQNEFPLWMRSIFPGGPLSHVVTRTVADSNLFPLPTPTSHKTWHTWKRELANWLAQK